MQVPVRTRGRGTVIATKPFVTFELIELIEERRGPVRSGGPRNYKGLSSVISAKSGRNFNYRTIGRSLFRGSGHINPSGPRAHYYPWPMAGRSDPSMQHYCVIVERSQVRLSLRSLSSPEAKQGQAARGDGPKEMVHKRCRYKEVHWHSII